ncbi:MAG TPA: hypothetical protein VGK74_15610 [Symbiobacteriaceae bacterium]|jgi:hypothetical protein
MCPRGERGAFLREQSRRHRFSVSTLKRYCRPYREQELDGLKAKQGRSDKGKARTIPPEVLQQAVALREADPARSTFHVLTILEQMYPDQKGTIKRSTLARHFQQLGKTRQALRKEPKASYRHFRKRHRNDL